MPVILLVVMLTIREAAFAEQGVLPFLPDGPDHVVPFLDLGHQLGDLLRRVLQVGVEGDHDLAAASFEGGEDRHVLAEVAVELDHPDLGVAGGKLLQNGEGSGRGSRHR